MNKRYFRLNEDAPLFNILSQRPLWWEMLLDDKELYVSIRKENRVNVYYRGASIMSLSYKDNNIDAEIHNYYLGAYKDGTNYYGNKHCSPEEIVRQLSVIKAKVDSNKKYIACLPGQEKNGKNYSSEKYFQSQLFLADSHFIDTEFALQLDDGTNIRIDFVKLTDDGEIAFQELKLIDDSRLKPSGENSSEILTQMANYDRFLKEADLLKCDNGEAIIVEYYRKVLNVMSAIGVKHINAVPISVRGYVDLFIKQIYTKKTIKRDHLVQSVLNACKNLHSNVEDVAKEYSQLI